MLIDIPIQQIKNIVSGARAIAKGEAKALSMSQLETVLAVISTTSNSKLT
jgi:hypothetical protein